MIETAADRIMEYGVLGTIFILSLGIAAKIIIVLHRANEEKNKQLRADFEEMRKIARGEALNAAEGSRRAIEENTRVMERVEIILNKFLNSK